MAHLSIDGLMAGAMFCGTSRNSALGNGEEFFHPNLKLLENRIYRQKICSECLAVWDNPECSTNPMPGLPLHGAAVGKF